MGWRKMPSIHISVGLGRSIARSVVAGDVGFWSGPEPERGARLEQSACCRFSLRCR